jgi:ribonuclease P/MRP protein subunit RPP40
LPQELYESIQSDMDSKFSVPTYSRVILPLAELLSGEFFTEYIKKGNVLMLSEGKQGVNDVYSLRDGVLTLALEKESYERAGLAGEPDGAKGKRGARARWLVEINLRQPSMLHGKKRFDRIVYAFKNVLNKPVTWLFCNLEGEGLLILSMDLTKWLTYIQLHLLTRWPSIFPSRSAVPQV